MCSRAATGCGLRRESACAAMRESCNTVGKEHLAGLAALDAATHEQADLAGILDALERADGGNVGFELHQRGQARRNRVSQRFEQPVARRAAAQIGRGQPAAGHDHAPRARRLAGCGAETPYAALVFQGSGLEIAQLGDVGLFHGQPQRVQHGGGLFAHRIDLAALFDERIHAVFLKAIEHSARGERGHGALHERHVAVIAFGRGVEIGEVAAAVAGGHELLAHAVHALQHADAQRRAISSGFQRGHHAGRAAADDQYVKNRFVHAESFLYSMRDAGRAGKAGFAPPDPRFSP